MLQTGANPSNAAPMLPDNPDTGHPRVQPIPNLIHENPSTQPYCQDCGAYLDGWPLIVSAYCEKCEEREAV